MAAVIEEHHLIKTDIDNNNNKFWIGKLYDNGDVFVNYGRVGESGTEKYYTGRGEKYFKSKLREKLGKRKNYKPAKLAVAGTAKTKTVGGSKLKYIAKKQIKHTNPTTAVLIDYFTDVNRHQIYSASGGKIVVDKDDNLIKTPMGVVNQEAIDGARLLLGNIGNCTAANDLASKKFKTAVAQYCMLIPQAVGRKRGWDQKLFPNLAAVQKQNSLLDSLQVTLTHVLGNPADDSSSDEVFHCDLTLSEDGKLMDRIKKLYGSTRQAMHACYGMKVKRVFLVDIKTMRKAYENYGAKLPNIWELWHGTQASNVLSILKGGLIIPPSGAGHVTGRAFGDGLYFSDQSTKSLNYAQGYWSGTSAKKCYMFLSEVAMGKYHTPPRFSHHFKRTKGYDSTFAKANVSGVMNNEMIVYSCAQANLKLLVEFVV